MKPSHASRWTCSFSASAIGLDHPPKELLDEATFRAIRDGLDARLCIGGPVQHVQGLARQALDLAFGYAPTLECAGALHSLERLLADGNGAERQRRAHARGGLPAVLEQLADETSTTRSHHTPRMTGDALGAA